MRKHLLNGTALVAAAMFVAGGAVAADKKMMKPSISVNGYYEGVVGGILDEDTEADTTALDTRTDAEIHFNGRGSTDNGMKVHARVELEGQNNHSAANAGGDPIDEYFISVSGAFGQIILGGTGGVPVKMLTGLSGSWATGVGENLSFDDGWVPSVSGNFHELRHSRLDSGDAEKVSYISPKLGGFSVGVTYSPNRMNNDDNSRPHTNALHDGFEAAASYGGKFGDVGFGMGAGMTNYQASDAAGSEDWSDWLVAARLDFGGGFRVAGAYKQTTDPTNVRASIVDLGVRYVQGANSFSLTGMHGEMDDTDASHTKIMASYARGMGPGVKVHLNALWNESSNADGSATNTGTALITGIKVGF